MPLSPNALTVIWLLEVDARWWFMLSYVTDSTEWLCTFLDQTSMRPYDLQNICGLINAFISTEKHQDLDIQFVVQDLRGNDRMNHLGSPKIAETVFLAQSVELVPQRTLRIGDPMVMLCMHSPFSHFQTIM